MTTTLSTMQVASTLSISFAAVQFLARRRLLKPVAPHKFDVETVRAFVASGAFQNLRTEGRI